MIPYVVVSMARSGTQLLAGLLRQHPDVIDHGEVLNQFDESLIDDVALVERCYRPLHCLRAEAVGITLLQANLSGRPMTLPTLLAYPNMHLIVLQRRDQLARIRSMVQAGEAWRWDVDTPPPVQLPPVCLDPFSTLQALQCATSFYHHLRQITSVPLAWVTYEELVEDHDEVMESLWAFLDLDYPGPVHPPTFRQEYRALGQTVVNLDELRAYLTGTSYEYLLGAEEAHV